MPFAGLGITRVQYLNLMLVKDFILKRRSPFTDKGPWDLSLLNLFSNKLSIAMAAPLQYAQYMPAPRESLCDDRQASHRQSTLASERRKGLKRKPTPTCSDFMRGGSCSWQYLQFLADKYSFLSCLSEYSIWE